MEWVVKITFRPLYPPKKDPIPTAQEAEWDPRPGQTSAENLTPTGTGSPNRPACSDSLYWLRPISPHRPQHINSNYMWISIGFLFTARHLNFKPCQYKTVMLQHDWTTSCKTVDLWFDSWQKQEIFLFSKVSRPGLGPSQPPNRHRGLPSKAKQSKHKVDQSALIAMTIRTSELVPPFPTYAFTACTKTTLYSHFNNFVKHYKLKTIDLIWLVTSDVRRCNDLYKCELYHFQ